MNLKLYSGNLVGLLKGRKGLIVSGIPRQENVFQYNPRAKKLKATK